MFAPPPIQLTREQIDSLMAEAAARKTDPAIRKSEETDRDLTKTKSNSSDSTLTKLRNIGSESLNKTKPAGSDESSRTRSSRSKPFRVTGIFSRGSKTKEHKQTSPKSPTSPEAQLAVSPQRADVQQGQANSPFTQSERRRAPKRPARPPQELLLPLVRSAVAPYPPPQSSPPPPPVPGKSPKKERHSVNEISAQSTELASQQVVFALDGLSKALTGSGVDDDRIPRQDVLADRPRPDSMLLAVGGSNGGAFMKLERTRRATVAETGSRSDSRRPSNNGVNGSKVDKRETTKRTSAAAAARSSVQEMSSLHNQKARRVTESSLGLSATGETITMLIKAGFSPVKDHHGNIVIRTTDLPPPHDFDSKELPATPGSMTSTPTELYHTRASQSKPVIRNRELGAAVRSPLSQITQTSAGANSSSSMRAIVNHIPSAGLSALDTENSPPVSGVTTPTATQIYLPGGSVLTVTPPEMTPWIGRIYLQGPIKLPKPTIVPRKNSVASLEPFQEAVDALYQDSLSVTRRRSDDAVVDDICEWFDDFGFAEANFAGDQRVFEDILVDDIRESDEDEFAEVERYSTPPPEPVASPAEVVAAKEMVDAMARLVIPPVDTEETLRARGIARLSQFSTGSRRSVDLSSNRKESTTLPKDSISQFTPVPETNTLQSPVEGLPAIGDADLHMTDSAPDQVPEWDDSVQEMASEPAWVAPALAHNKLSRGLRRFVSSAM